jgi:hypothetical protein
MSTPGGLRRLAQALSLGEYMISAEGLFARNNTDYRGFPVECWGSLGHLHSLRKSPGNREASLCWSVM